MVEQAPRKRSAWQEANGNGWLGLALLVFCVTAGALIFGTNSPKVAEEQTQGQVTRQ
ncbi:MAG: hypothetical protein AB7E67_00065 [Xanthobacteraceae bacterium]